MIRELRDPPQKRSWWIFHVSGYIISHSNDFTVTPHEGEKIKMYILLFFQSWLNRITCWDSLHTPEGTFWWEIDWCEEVWCCKGHAEKPLWLSFCFVISVEQQGELVGQKLRVGKLVPCELRAAAERFFFSPQMWCTSLFNNTNTAPLFFCLDTKKEKKKKKKNQFHRILHRFVRKVWAGATCQCGHLSVVHSPKICVTLFKYCLLCIA